MDKDPSQKSAVQSLHPPIDPFDQRMIDVGDGHTLYVEQCGRPDGVPVVVLHGGPGGGCSPAMRRYFDPKVYRVVLFDQRGCGRSQPHASVAHNTTWDLVADIEKIRELLGIEKWIGFGGSWGATLALVYALTHPDRVRALVLRGVFLMTRPELDWFYGGGAGRFFPDTWSSFAGMIPEAERDDLIGAYHARLFSGNLPQETKFAQAWSAWENALASIQSDGAGGRPPGHYARAFARLENHYFTNLGFLPSDDYIVENVRRIAHLPGWIVQGRYDMICPPISAHRLANQWPSARLHMMPLSGHALSEPNISRQLVEIMDILPQRVPR
ncbi:prolyl aminopeptidase [Pseudaestuariivita atlantica]|uniref:Proline iminopeptidase n=1 Tax=Pseudaestuariivita atlantica TaxID=1317121 RepID=A0A0L1JPH8_9RHOB|nr:prolyl aminopeptidase [Pseudaestuariivita atlantica]KNG93669.1 proline iminopeptidase [Pseudaestuariivita atlantica]